MRDLAHETHIAICYDDIPKTIVGKYLTRYYAIAQRLERALRDGARLIEDAGDDPSKFDYDAWAATYESESLARQEDYDLHFEYFGNLPDREGVFVRYRRERAEAAARREEKSARKLYESLKTRFEPCAG